MVRFGEVTTTLEDSDGEQPDTLHKQVCLAALNMLAKDGIYSFGEVLRQQWESRAQDALEAVQSGMTEHKPQWRNPDVVGALDGFHERPHSATSEQLHLTIHQISTLSLKAEDGPTDAAATAKATRSTLERLTSREGYTKASIHVPVPHHATAAKIRDASPTTACGMVVTP
jgi:hypothetical protein